MADGPAYPANQEISEWLSREKLEPVLEPELPIIDPHHHLWDVRRPEDICGLPKGFDEMVKGWRQKVYMLPELLNDVYSGHRVLYTVYIQVWSFHRADGPQAFRPVGEVEFAQGVAAMCESGLYGPARPAAGIVGLCDPADPCVQEVLQTMRTVSRNFRGIRIPIANMTDLETPQFLRGMSVLQNWGLSCDIFLRDVTELPKVAALARRYPDTTIVVDHMGSHIGPRLGEVGLQKWRIDLAEVAACPNTICKVGGAQMPKCGFGFEARELPVSSEEMCDLVLPYYGYAIDCFSPQRCMFESNFPVDRASVSYRTLWNTFKRIALAKQLCAADKFALFYGTAARVYRLPTCEKIPKPLKEPEPAHHQTSMRSGGRSNSRSRSPTCRTRP